MEPIPETDAALARLTADQESSRLRDDLVELANHAQELVPDLVGVSITPRVSGLTFTLVATADQIAVLDAVQYAAGGPCDESAKDGDVRLLDQHELLSEERWQLFARASAAHTVRSTLTLPIVDDGTVVGTVNLYAASVRAFDDPDALGAVFGAWAAGAVSNADLSFSSRDRARAAPRQLDEQRLVDVAVGMLATRFGLEPDAARQRLHAAAARAGVDVPVLARAIVDARD